MPFTVQCFALVDPGSNFFSTIIVLSYDALYYYSALAHALAPARDQLYICTSIRLQVLPSHILIVPHWRQPSYKYSDDDDAPGVSAGDQK